MTKETDATVRGTCFSVWAQLIHVLSVYDWEGYPAIFSVFDIVVVPLVNLVLKNERNKQISPALSAHVLELFGMMSIACVRRLRACVRACADCVLPTHC
jgi:hypothetical protein